MAVLDRGYLVALVGLCLAADEAAFVMKTVRNCKKSGGHVGPCRRVKNP